MSTGSRPGGLPVLAAFCALLFVSWTSFARAQTFTLEKTEFAHDEIISIPYRFSSRPGSKSLGVFGDAIGGAGVGTNISAEHPELNDYDELAGTLQFIASDLVNRDSFLNQGPFYRATVQLREGAPGEHPAPIVAEEYIYVLNPVRTLPGSITLPAGPFLPGQEIEVTVNKPEPEADYLESSWTVSVYKPGSSLEDGSVVLPRTSGGSIAVRDAGESLHRLKLPTRPGPQEVLVQDEAGFVIDRVPIEIDFALPEVTLSVDGALPVRAGDHRNIAARGLYYGMPYLDFGVDTLRPGPRETWQSLGVVLYPGPAKSPIEIPSRVEAYPPVSVGTQSPGLHRLIAGWIPSPLEHHLGWLRAGSLDISVAPEEVGTYRRPAGMMLADDGVYFPGELISFSVDELPFGLPPPDEVRIYQIASGEVAEPLQGFRAGAEPIHVQAVNGVPSNTTLLADLPPGSYELVLVSNPGAGSEARAVADLTMTVLPPAGEFGITANSGRPVYAYAPFNIDVEIPEPFGPDDERFFVQLVHLGGSLQGCRVIMEHVAFHRATDEGTGTQLFFGDWDGTDGPKDWPLPAPGLYEARLYFGEPGWASHSSLWPSATLVASSRFEVVYRTAPGALILESEDPDDETVISLRVELPASFDGVDRSSIAVDIDPLPDEAKSGAERLNWPRDGRYGGGIPLPRSDEPQSIIVGPVRAGAYELTLTQAGFCFLGDCARVLLDSLAFEVRDPDWKGRLRLVAAPSSLAPERLDPDGFARMDPPGACGGEDAEKMVLSFSRLLDGRPVPLEGPIDHGYPFFVEGRLEEPARRQIYHVILETPSGVRRSIALYPVPDDPTLLRSELTYVMWDVEAVATDLSEGVSP